jgi:hypothetical protein
MSIVLPLAQFFNVEDLSREVVSSVINTVNGNIKLVRKISQALYPLLSISKLIIHDVQRVTTNYSMT